ncbi:UDP-N-acetylmuramate:L-alanyl-gamma-D-glutamyl-meso-diaminopimelate ligase [Aliidiomarina halalkaliphila]|uniref:UDP-N-acetylmuramate--L-alanyl-gamma-D-glutamyl-meso-2,6-diaminoheptandioate ligase n=1 Tax=Aliidiomarina halalkaliphila TaxID=2593535 RepID=A0A552WZD3_9GAMM|nr:UDP-N-acetylmuramate:L-alanyl-gamma-D-glutamyl-meso-diaminopimelate ligase [Aliidiomarina halalkaliphila]TRW48180.1 UDP-N-acetylmuramate:L-alanyl-gamma-D-glutamyl-meso-diaminopimelate ligase [Aliidiomarina halalkaliphila]
MAHIHILGICGTFMGGIAALATAMGHRVTGSDRNVYPPMSTQLEKLGIALTDDQDLTQLEPAPDLVIIGNALSRGHALVETVLQQRIRYTSGPQWLGEQLLRHKHVLAVAGTHGKTTTASMLTWILEAAGKHPGFLVGGVVQPFGQTARLTDSELFVIEADEYDTAFFDKRSKFVHYFSDTLILNNLEYDHADIFPDLAAIQRQFEHLLRTVPNDGQVLYASDEPALIPVVQSAPWVKHSGVGPSGDWDAELLRDDASAFRVMYAGKLVGEVHWGLIGVHNVRNGLMAIAAAANVGVDIATALQALSTFEAPARRLQLRADKNGIRIYDDFAHHPTAIQTTLHALRARVGRERIVAIFEPRSNTMKAGVHKDTLAAAFRGADSLYALQPEGVSWRLEDLFASLAIPVVVRDTVAELVAAIHAHEQGPGHWLVMSNGGFGGIHQQLIDLAQVANKSGSTTH